LEHTTRSSNHSAANLIGYGIGGLPHAELEKRFMTNCFMKVSICVLSILCSFCMAQAQQCTPPPSGMVAWYAGEGNTNDSLGTNNGTPQNGTAFAAGKVGQAFSLNGANQFVSLPANFISYPAIGTGAQPISVDAWFQTVTGGVILGQQGLATPPAAPSGAVPAIYVGTDGFLYVELFWKGSVAPISSFPTKVNNGVFHHVAVTYDGVTEAVYLDGLPIGAMPLVQVAYAASYQYQIGAGFTAGWPSGNGAYFYFQGLIDEIEFFNRALTVAEIQAIVNVGSAGKCRNRAPVAVCKSVTVQACALPTVSIDGGSSDPDAGDILTLSQSPAGPYPTGTTMVTLTVTDNHGASSQCSGTVTVSNSTSLTVASLTATPKVLWPPNDRMVPVTVTASASSCSAVTCKIVSVTSNESAAGDSTITGDLTVNLRARRSGNGNGRVYTIMVRCTDASGNSTTKTVNVTVPHDQGDKRGDDDDDDDEGDHGKGKGKGNGNDDDRGNR
jgi:Concanavalin A-like lectin/glucanases superfamily